MSKRDAPVALATAALALPVVAFVVMTNVDGWDPRLRAPTPHFWIVSATTLVAAGISAALMLTVESIRTTRTVFLALGFMAVAMIFAGHGLSTPGFIVPASQESYGVRVSSGLSQVVGASLIFLSVLPEWSPLNRLAQRAARWLMPGAFVVLLAYLVVILGRPETLAFVPDDRAFDATLALITIALLGYAGWRYWRAWRLTQQPAQFAMVASLALLAETQVSLYWGTVWQASWWLYHFLMLAAFLVLVAGWAYEARRAGSLLLFARTIALRDTLDRVDLANPATLDALESAMAARDPYTRHHMCRVGEYAAAIAREMKLEPRQIQVCELAGRLHDIGKIAIPDAVLLKPAELTAEEWAIMRTHPGAGEHIALSSRILRDIARAVRCHHERYDGSGYPDGIAGDAIPVEARIIAVADTFDAIVTRRIYREARSPAEAVDEIHRVAGAQLDPECVAAFDRWLAAGGLLTVTMEHARAA